MSEDKTRCGWGDSHPLYVDYHDREWGVPIHGEREWFELLTLEGMQAGLSWLTILKKRESFRLAFDRFEPEAVARYDQARVADLLANEGILRNRQKIEAAVGNARAFLALQGELGSFDRYIWDFVGGEPVQNRWRTLEEIPAQTEISSALSKDLKARGFKFVGPTICYALMQSGGLVNDHLVSCFRHAELGGGGADCGAGF
ncbi:MAG: DNA-3-methyladenine glycosylase I [Chloroflexota bacterium]